MTIIDKNGNIVEGVPVTPKDLLTIADLTADSGLYEASKDYISLSVRQRLAAYLVATYHMERRVPFVPKVNAENIPVSNE